MGRVCDVLCNRRGDPMLRKMLSTLQGVCIFTVGVYLTSASILFHAGGWPITEKFNMGSVFFCIGCVSICLALLLFIFIMVMECKDDIVAFFQPCFADVDEEVDDLRENQVAADLTPDTPRGPPLRDNIERDLQQNLRLQELTNVDEPSRWLEPDTPAPDPHLHQPQYPFEEHPAPEVVLGPSALQIVPRCRIVTAGACSDNPLPPVDS